MFSQFDNDNLNRIRRSKSATSVKERRKRPIISEPFNVETGRVHALIAAHRAMDRSQGSTSDDLCRSDSSNSKRSARQAQSQHEFFASSSAQIQRQNSVISAKSPSLAASLPVLDSGNSKRECLPSYNQAAFSDLGLIDEGEPSSYRRLRKAKSALNPGRG